MLGGDQPSPRAGVGTPACIAAASPLHRIRLSWKAPNAGTVLLYTVYRSTGSTLGVQDLKSYTGITSTSFDDTEELPDGVAFTYVVKATFGDSNGGTGTSSNQVVVVARNDAPAAAADSYAIAQDTTLTVTAAGVLGNDTDVDSVNPLLRVSADSPVTPPAHGSLTLNADGSLTYAPIKNFTGTDSFTYKARDNRRWPLPPATGRYPMSSDSTPTTVTITVTKKNGR